MIGNFNPSKVLNEVYSILESYETEGLDLYNDGAVDAVIDYFNNYAKVEFLLCCSPWPNNEGGVCAVSFVEDGHPQMVAFDYKR